MATPPPPAASGTDWYGTGVKGRYIRPRSADETDWALGPIEAPRTGNLASFATYFIFAEKDQYFAGTGGINRFTIRQDVNGQPGSTVLGEFTITNPTASGGIWSDWASARGNWSHFGFNNQVAVTAGARYWVVAENLHANPSGNWVGINSITSGDGAPGTAFVYKETSPGSNVFERFSYPGEGWFVGLFDLKYKEGDGFGQGYYHAKFEHSIGGATQAREVFTPTSDQSVTGLRVWAERTGGSGGLTAKLTRNGSVITQSTVSGSGWVAFPLSTTLQAGTTYAIEFSAPSGTTYKFTVLRENTGWSNGSRFTDGYADYNSGSGWTGGWPIYGSTRQEGDLMFYFS